MPKLWTDTIDTHHQAVRDAALDAAAKLVAAHGLAGVTMSAIAGATGVGRATLYKYFPDTGAILRALHERQISRHLAQLAAIRHAPGDAHARLEAVLRLYAQIVRDQPVGPAVEQLHGGDHARHAALHLRQFLAGLIAEAATAGTVRRDIDTGELAAFCLAALASAAALPDEAAVQRLVVVVLAGLAVSDRPASAPRPAGG